MITLPPAVRDLIARLNEAGFSAYAVGGCVRDSLLGRVPSDWDLCTSALPEDMLRVFRDERVAETGLRAWIAGRTVSPATDCKGKAKARQRAEKIPGKVYEIPRRRS